MNDSLENEGQGYEQRRISKFLATVWNNVAVSGNT